MSIVTKPPCDEGVIQTKSEPTLDTAGAERWILAATILGSSLAFVDGTVVNVALPAIQTNLGATIGSAQWVVQAYTLLLAALILVAGSLGDRYGRRRIFALGVTVFALASICCAVSPTISLLIAARAVQGIGAALLVPSSLALISASFDEARRGRAIGTWSGFTAITTAVGPVLGGWLVDHASWRWVFLINIPLAVAVLLIVWRRVPESHDEGASVLDWWGAGLATIGLGVVTYGLTEAGSRGIGDPLAISVMIGGLVILTGFVAVEWRTAAPMMPLALFRSRTFSGANLLTIFLYAAMSGIGFFFPFALIQVHGYSPTAAGAAMLPFIFLMFVLSRWSGGLVARYGAKRPLVVGPLMTGIGVALYAIPGIGGSYWTTFFPAVTVQGLGMAISVAPLTTTVMSAVDQRHAGIASGINNAASRVGGLLAIAVLGIFLVQSFNHTLDQRLAELAPPPSVHQQLDRERGKLAAMEIPASVSGSERARLERAIDEAFIAGFRVVALIAAGLSVLSAIVAWLMISGSIYGPPPPPKAPPPVRNNSLVAAAKTGPGAS